MAEVMQPLLQPSNTASMLHPRPSSADAFQTHGNTTGGQQHHHHRPGQTPRSMYNSQAGYRGTAGAPVQPYAFQSTPHLRQETRTISAPAIHTQASVPMHGGNTSRHSFAHQPNASPSPSSTGKRSPSKDDFTSGDRHSSVISLSSSVPDLSLTNFEPAPRSSPDRYRRAARRTDSNNSTTASVTPPSFSPSSAAPSGSGMSSVEHLYTSPVVPISRTTSDDHQSSKSSEAAKRYRRRSLGNMETTSSQSSTPRPASSHGTTSRQSPPSTIRPVSMYDTTPSAETAPGRSVTPPSHDTDGARSRPQSPKVSPSSQSRSRDASPVRASGKGASDANKRLTTPSPLSQAAYTRDENSNIKESETVAAPSKAALASSPAAQHLAALSDKDLNKGMKSRLRRAFSFGSAAELRKASSENAAPQQSQPRKELTPEEAEAEQEEIARRQEAAGIGAGIYSGQGGFAGSTDNLSISSTASSASLMLRKMGKGMKKGGRSLKGLFRPKSVVGVPAADGPVQPSLAEVSMVTVEAERQRVNVNVNPADQAGGGTGFPKLERNSVEATHNGVDARSSHDRNDSMRRSIVGSEKERAEVLAAVRKGILKRAGTGSPQPSPMVPHQTTPFMDPAMHTSPPSSMPTTPRDERQSRSLTSTNSNSSNDYFSTRANGGPKSMPATPSSGRNISFSPRIQFHDVWSSTEYDRRGEIATCNRLTPMLAQQIKEELNTFKMEMEVHEMSKPHTHFF